MMFADIVHMILAFPLRPEEEVVRVGAVNCDVTRRAGLIFLRLIVE
jgi:hypothetical protein